MEPDVSQGALGLALESSGMVEFDARAWTLIILPGLESELHPLLVV